MYQFHSSFHQNIYLVCLDPCMYMCLCIKDYLMPYLPCFLLHAATSINITPALKYFLLFKSSLSNNSAFPFASPIVLAPTTYFSLFHRSK